MSSTEPASQSQASATSGTAHATNFTGNFTQQEGLPEEAIAAAVALMQSGRLHRYNTAAGETSEAALLEQEFAAYLGVDHCLACTSGGYALAVAMRAWGVTPGTAVLTNAFTLSPVPGAIANCGGKPVLVETTADLVLDLDHLEQCIRDSGARLLLLSHMRGNIVDMERLCQVLDRHGVALIEDCAHTMGASWNGRKSGTFGVAACFSTQTYKHMNSGEGGLLTSNDAGLIARATLMSGSYMLYQRHGTPPPEQAFEAAKWQMPNMSGRMDNLRAAILRPQLRLLDENCQRWNQRYHAWRAMMVSHPRVVLPARPETEQFVASSAQFSVASLSPEQPPLLVSAAMQRGVELKWFGGAEPHGFTSRFDSWHYIEPQDLPGTHDVLSRLFDLRLPLTFSLQQCEQLGQIICECVDELAII